MYRPRQPGAGEATVGALPLSHGFAVLVTHGGAVRHCSDRTLRADMGWCRGGQGRPWVSEIDFPRIPCCVASVARSFAHHMTSKPSPGHLVSAGLRPPRPLANTAARPDPPSARALLRACLEPPTHRLRPSHWRIRRALAMRRCHRLPEFATRLGLRAGSKGLALR